MVRQFGFQPRHRAPQVQHSGAGFCGSGHQASCQMRDTDACFAGVPMLTTWARPAIKIDTDIF